LVFTIEQEPTMRRSLSSHVPTHYRRYRGGAIMLPTTTSSKGSAGR